MLLFQYVMHENKAGFVCKIEHAPLLDQMLHRLRHPEADIRNDNTKSRQSIELESNEARKRNMEV